MPRQTEADHKRDMSRALQRWVTRHRISASEAARRFDLPLRTFQNYYYGVLPCPFATLLEFRLKFDPDGKNT